MQMDPDHPHGTQENSVIKLLSQPEPDANALSLEETHTQLRLVHGAARLISDTFRNHEDTQAARDDNEPLEGNSISRKSGSSDLELAWLELLGISRRRATLWAHLAAISRLPAQQPALDKLPVEILKIIFEYLGMPRLKSIDDIWRRELHHGRWHSTNRRAVQNLRLVCRLFNRLASSLLFPYLFLSIDEESLDLARRISETPHLAVGVRGIVIFTSFCIQRLTQDFSLYREVVYRELRHYLNDMEFQASSDEFQNDAAHFAALCSAWDETGYLNATCPGGIDLIGDELFPHTQIIKIAERNSTYHSAAREEFRNVFTQGYHAYCTKYQSQVRLTEEGTFVQNLVDSIRRMPQFQDLVFTRGHGTRRWTASLTYWGMLSSCRRALRNRSALLKFMSEPQAWVWEVALMNFRLDWPQQLITQLPIALSDAGIRLLHLDLDHLSIRRDPPRRANDTDEDGTDEDGADEDGTDDNGGNEGVTDEEGSGRQILDQANPEQDHAAGDVRSVDGPDHHVTGQSDTEQDDPSHDEGDPARSIENCVVFAGDSDLMWRQLGIAFQSLQSVRLDMSGTHFREARFTYVFLECYVQAAMLSRNLRCFHMEPSGIDMLWQPRGTGIPPLCFVEWPLLEKLSLAEVEVTSEQMEHVCNTLSRDTLKSVSLEWALLTRGTWASIIDMLRNKTRKPTLKSWTHSSRRRELFHLRMLLTGNSSSGSDTDESNLEIPISLKLFSDAEVGDAFRSRTRAFTAEVLAELYLGRDPRVHVNPLLYATRFD